MRSASSYRGAKKAAAREAGVPFSQFNEHYRKSRVFAANQLMAQAIHATPEAAAKALAIWAANGGRATAISPAVTATELEAMNKPVPVPTEQAVKAAAKLTPADVDKALEAALSNWQRGGHEDPLPLTKMFAARARQLGWVEDVEFVEEK